MTTTTIIVLAHPLGRPARPVAAFCRASSGISAARPRRPPASPVTTHIALLRPSVRVGPQSPPSIASREPYPLDCPAELLAPELLKLFQSACMQRLVRTGEARDLDSWGSA
eukprot:1644925-Pyramimonas_sp.AAC.1